VSKSGSKFSAKWPRSERRSRCSKQVAVTLYWLASSAEYRTIGNLFGVGKSTVCSIVHKVCEAIYEDLLNVYVKFPTGDELNLGDSRTVEVQSMVPIYQ
jgi:hypothetical protein